MKLRVSILAKAALGIGALLFPCIVSAQFLPSASFSLSADPAYPAPYSTVVISVQNSSVDITASTIVATVGSTVVYSGNVRPFPVSLGAAGTPVQVKVVLSSGNAKSTAILSLTPGDVSLVEEPVATAPPLYPGKPVVPLAGSVRFAAIADFRTASGVHIDPASLAYIWTVDDTTMQGSSGIGKTSIIVPVPLQYRASAVSVVVKTLDGSEVGEGDTTITGNEPIVRLYENDPLLGIRFDHALSGAFPITESEVSLFGVPYSFSLDNGAPVLSWLLNGDPAQTGAALTLRPQGSGAGNASLTFKADQDATFESASQNLSVTFGNSSGGGLFGL